MVKEQDAAHSFLRNQIAEIIKNGVTYNHQTSTVIIHGAIDDIVKLIQQDAARSREFKYKHMETIHKINMKQLDELTRLRSELQQERELRKELVEGLGCMYFADYGGNSKTLEEAMERAPISCEYEQRIIALIKKSTK